MIATPQPKSARLYQAVAERIARSIASGQYRKGDRLPAERDLAAQYDVSRPTVREAIIALEIDGLVEVRVGSGVYVAERKTKIRPCRHGHWRIRADRGAAAHRR